MPLTFHWHTEPFLLLSILIPGWLYALVVGPWRDRFGPGEKYPVREAAMFFAALAVVYIAVGSPLDSIGETFLFSAHMTQHMLLIYVAPPMIIRGLPAWLVDGIMLRNPRFHRVCKVLVHPACGGVLFMGLFSIWHFPELYEWALMSRPVHIVEHWMMFAPAFLMMWPVLSTAKTLPCMREGSLMIYGFLLMIGDLPLWAALIFGDSPIYRTYEMAPRICSLSPMGDQMSGAIIMKLFNEASSLLMMGCAFFRWAKKEENR